MTAAVACARCEGNAARKVPFSLLPGQLTFAQAGRLDPSRTLSISRAFSREATRRFRWLQKVIRGAVVDKDVFALAGESSAVERVGAVLDRKGRGLFVVLELPSVESVLDKLRTRQFDFPRSSRKAEAFMGWLDEMQQQSVLEIVRRPGAVRGFEEVWSDRFIRHSYQRGVARGRDELRASGRDIPSFSPDREQDIAMAFNQPFHADRVGMLYTRTFDELKGVTAAMDQQMSRVLGDGLAAGLHPLQIARALNNRVDKIGLSRAKMIARTEVMRAHHAANINEYKAAQVLGVRLVVEWETAADPCEECAALATRTYTVKEIEGLLPAHPNCFLDGQVPIYTSEGWKGIGRIKVGDLVLSHKGRFRKVTHLHHTKRQIPFATKFHLADSGRTVSMTSNHPVLAGRDRRWVEAGKVKKGDSLWIRASRCKRCEELVPFYKNYCSRSCLSLDITNRQWSDPEHRKRVSSKNKKSMLKQYASGDRNRHKITERAREEAKHLAGERGWPLQWGWVRDRIRETTNTPEQRQRASTRMRKQNPVHDPEVCEKMKASLKKTYHLYPEKRLNSRLARMRWDGKKTRIEARMARLLDRIGVAYEYQYKILSYSVDFAIPSLRIVIECDSAYWHRDREYDARRQKRIEEQGWFVLRYTDAQINAGLSEVKGELTRIFMNHRGEYEFCEIPVSKVEHWQVERSRTLYNLTVEEDESYVTKGVVVHNCRCVAVPLPVDEEVRGKR